MTGIKNRREKKERRHIWKPFIKFYTRFKTPWWLFILSAIGSIVYAELNLSFVAQFTISLNTGELYNRVILGYAAVTIGMSLLTVAYNMASSYGAGIVTLRARKVILRKLIYLPSNIFDKQQPSEYVSRMTAHIPQASTTITYLCLCVSSIYGFARAFIILFQYNVTITCWLLLVIPIAVALFWFVGYTQYLSYKRIYKSVNKMTAFFSEHLSTMKHCKAQAMEEAEIKAGFAAIEDRYKSQIFYSFMVAAQTSAYSIYSKICFLILVFTGKNLLDKGKIDSSVINVGNTYLNNVQQYLAEILTQYQTIKGTQGVMNQVTEIAGYPVEEPQRSIAMPAEEADLVVEGVSFGYNPSEEVLHDVSITFPASKKSAIVGANGCGKSTLFKLLMRFYTPDEGTIYYGDQKAEDIHLNEWRKNFGYVLQNSILLSGTIRENIVYGCDREVGADEMIAAAKAANAYDFIMEFPEGFDKQVGEGGSYLSGGQRQRITIARAIITNPKVLLLDEATAQLDYVSDELVREAVDRLMAGRTTIVIAHDMSAVLGADNIVVMNGGKVEAQGSHEYLLENSSTYANYVGLQKAAEEQS